ncbi:MAG: histidine phosphatase family protein [Geminicoccaceae bacterium]|jgi:broad specificity phosphatase PhoE|nr:histidine phosphatase family protein [Rhodospirillales bacterium]MCB9967953.1 histidine phosphatase family protein [Geminicoccaceae bacterium]HRY24176.1 histidine phosphatase family protein [Geminicoccaceae bacterium]
MTVIYYLSHPEVTIDPAIPVPGWGLSATGRARVLAVRDAAWLRACRRIVTSAERKAVETAELVAETSAAEIVVRPAMHENDRSATGFLVPAEFEQVASEFFARPEESVRGWERASDAQARIAGELEAVLAGHDPTLPLLLVGHGGVGTLLYCRHAGLAIDRRHDQPRSGSVFALDARSLAPLFTWRPMEEVERVLGPC